MFQGHISHSFCQSYAIKSSCIIIIAYHNIAGLILEMIYFPWERITRKSIISTESVKIRKRKLGWVSDFRRACGSAHAIAFFLLPVLAFSLSLFSLPCFSRRLSFPCGRAEFNTATIWGKKRAVGKRDWFREIWRSWRREKLKAPQAGKRWFGILSLSVGTRARAGAGAMRLEVFEIVCRASRNINRA